MYLVLPLLAALAFAWGSLVFKRAFAEGAGVVHGVVVNNVVLGLIFFPLVWLEPHPIPWDRWYEPVLTAATFVVGHLLNVVSLRVGDVSIATPLLGSKVIFVALVGRWVFGVELTPDQWWAAGLATSGVMLMGLTDWHAGGKIGLTTLCALGCAGSFALTDTMIQAWGGSFGVIAFLGLQFAALGVLSLATLPFFGLRSLKAPRAAWKWMGVAAALSAVQAIIITGTIAVWKDAAGVNVVYATRGLMSIALVWLVGHWIQNTERHTVGGRRMGIRLVGGLLILAAVVLTARRDLTPSRSVVADRHRRYVHSIQLFRTTD